MTAEPHWSEQPSGPPAAVNSAPVSTPFAATSDLPFASGKRSPRVPLIAAGVIISLALIVGVLVSRRGSSDATAAPRDTIPLTTVPATLPGAVTSENTMAAGGDDATPPSLPAGARALSEVAVKTLQQGTARMSMTVNMPIPGLSRGPMIVDGTVDLDRGVMSYVIDLSALLEGQDVPPGVDGKVDVVQSGLVMFMRGSVFDDIPGTKGKWLRLDITPSTAATGLDMDKVAAMSGNGPTSSLDMLKDAGSVVELGNDVVRGTNTRHYTASIDIETMYRTSGAVVDEDAFAGMLAAMTMTSIPVDVWIDDAGRVRRQEMVQNIGGAMMHSVVELYDFGVKTDIVMPKFSDSVDLMKLLAAS